MHDDLIHQKRCDIIGRYSENTIDYREADDKFVLGVYVYLITEKQMNLGYVRFVRVYLDHQLAWLEMHQQIRRIKLGILVCW